jgi:hypothetical protein
LFWLHFPSSNAIVAKRYFGASGTVVLGGGFLAYFALSEHFFYLAPLIVIMKAKAFYET